MLSFKVFVENRSTHLWWMHQTFWTPWEKLKILKISWLPWLQPAQKKISFMAVAMALWLQSSYPRLGSLCDVTCQESTLFLTACACDSPSPLSYEVGFKEMGLFLFLLRAVKQLALLDLVSSNEGFNLGKCKRWTLKISCSSPWQVGPCCTLANGKYQTRSKSPDRLQSRVCLRLLRFDALFAAQFEAS